ncbi:MAG: carboxylesterase family protein, partial [Burkholderiaceae bacterium]|nr:carboxylesterase family protein [Burkholderiaceae bacterium]
LQVLVGSNVDEMNLYHVPGGAMERITHAQVLGFAQDVGLPPGAVDAYATELPGRERTPGELLSALQSDFYYRVPAQRIAALASQWCHSAHRYEFCWPSPQWQQQLGAAHAVELPFVFGNLRTPQGLEFTGMSPPAALAQAMHHAWARFAHCGDPGWRPYTAAVPWVQYFDDTPRCEVHGEPARFTHWQGLL